MSAAATSQVRRAALAAAVAAGAEPVLRRAVGGHDRWRRRNFRDREVVLSGGPAVAAGVLVAVAVPPLPAAVIAGASAAVLGLYDDLYGDRHARGLRGHVAALRGGRVTTGMVKLVGLVVGGFAAGVVQRRRVTPALVDAALIAGTANLVNLLDLRPGRALKVCLISGAAASATAAPSAGGAASVVGAAAAVLPADLGEVVMIGDCGANTVGAVLGWAVSTGLRPAGRAVALAAVTGLTLTSERVSFTEVIASTPWLRALDEMGRR